MQIKIDMWDSIELKIMSMEGDYEPEKLFGMPCRLIDGFEDNDTRLFSQEIYNEMKSPREKKKVTL